jgi:drug/metabolite transporter (DMT)-like permease
MSDRHRSYFIGGIALALLGSICFSTKAIFVKLAYRDSDVDAITLLALRMLFSLPFFLISAIISSRQSDNVRFSRSQWFYIALIGCLGYYISSLLDFLGLQYISAGIERLVLFIYPTLVLIMSSVVFKVRISRYQWMALALTYAGLVIAFWGETHMRTSPEHLFKGGLLIFICAITYAMYIVGSGRIIPQVGASKFNSYAMTFASLAVLIHYFVFSENSFLNLSWCVYVYSFSMAIIGTVIPSYLVTAGIKRIGSDNAAIVGSIGPVSTIIQAFIFLQEPIILWQIIGTVLILAGVFMISRKPKAS